MKKAKKQQFATMPYCIGILRITISAVQKSYAEGGAVKIFRRDATYCERSESSRKPNVC